MLAAVPTRDEEARIGLLSSLQLLDTSPEDVFDRITQLAARVLDAPIALIALMDRDRLCFKSRVGLDLHEAPRERSFCAQAIHESGLFVIGDVGDDNRFLDNPLALSASVRFYAGAPIFSSRGIALGTLCVMDRRPRTLSVADTRTLQDLAELARREIIHRESAQASRLMHQYNHRNLEERVLERTQQLQQANDRLSLVIEEQHRSEASLRASQTLLHTLADVLPMHIIYVEADLTIRFINASVRADRGYSEDFEVGGKLSEILDSPLLESIRPQIAHALAGKQSTFETTTNRKRERFWKVDYIPDWQGEAVAGVYMISQDITAQKQVENSLQRKAMRDSLTGLPNRLALLERLESAANRADRSGDSFAVLFLDLDGFKAVNDRHGHEGGDTLLRQLAQRLKDCVRDSDTVARLAGDEFVIVLEALKNGSADAEQVCGKILQAVREPFAVCGEPCALSSSIGIYTRQRGQSIDAVQMITQADLAMYQAKRAGKNRLYSASVENISIKATL